jgi:hypothetical protein
MRYVTHIYALIILALAALPQASAAGPYAVHRSGDSLSVHGAQPLAVVAVSPYDDAVLADGLTHYYLVRDAGDNQVQISVHKNSPLGAVRIGFDDGDALTAPVDPTRSSVAVSRTTLPADGVSQAQVTIIPRDANSVPLGSGLEIAVDIEALSPGFVCGQVSDRGNGSYMFSIASALPGAGQVWISVEGVLLNDEPTITFEQAGGASDLRELAKQYLNGVSSISGAFEDALAGIDSLDPGAAKVYVAWDEALAGLAILNEDDYGLDRDVIDVYLGAAVATLVAALDDPGQVDPETIRGLIDDLLDICRLVAQFHFNRALDYCGPCDPGEAGALCSTEQALDKAATEHFSADPNYGKVVQRYGKAVDRALDAEGRCAG